MRGECDRPTQNRGRNANDAAPAACANEASRIPGVIRALGFAALSPAYGWHWRVNYAELEIGMSA